jgi:hypothetical protein
VCTCQSDIDIPLHTEPIKSLLPLIVLLVHFLVHVGAPRELKEL